MHCKVSCGRPLNKHMSKCSPRWVNTDRSKPITELSRYFGLRLSGYERNNVGNISGLERHLIIGFYFSTRTPFCIISFSYALKLKSFRVQIFKQNGRLLFLAQEKINVCDMVRKKTPKPKITAKYRKIHSQRYFENRAGNSCTR